MMVFGDEEDDDDDDERVKQKGKHAVRMTDTKESANLMCVRVCVVYGVVYTSCMR